MQPKRNSTEYHARNEFSLCSQWKLTWKERTPLQIHVMVHVSLQVEPQWHNMLEGLVIIIQCIGPSPPRCPQWQAASPPLTPSAPNTSCKTACAEVRDHQLYQLWHWLTAPLRTNFIRSDNGHNITTEESERNKPCQLWHKQQQTSHQGFRSTPTQLAKPAIRHIWGSFSGSTTEKIDRKKLKNLTRGAGKVEEKVLGWSPKVCRVHPNNRRRRNKPKTRSNRQNKSDICIDTERFYTYWTKRRTKERKHNLSETVLISSSLCLRPINRTCFIKHKFLAVFNLWTLSIYVSLGEYYILWNNVWCSPRHSYIVWGRHNPAQKLQSKLHGPWNIHSHIKAHSNTKVKIHPCIIHKNPFVVYQTQAI